MKIMYIHGLGSSANSTTAKLLKKYFPNDTIIVPEFASYPEDAMLDIEEIYYNENPDIVIGTSLGGFYASMLGGCYKILVNPAFNAGDDIEKYIGISNYELNGNVVDITEEFINSLNYLKQDFLTYYYDDDFINETCVLFSDNDELFGCDRKSNYVEVYKNTNCIDIPGGHRLSEDNIKNNLTEQVEYIRKKLQ